MGASASSKVSKGTTPTVLLMFNENDVDFTLAKNVYVTFESNLKTVTKCGDALDIQAHSILVTLDQADTLAFQLDSVEVQANWTYEGKRRACSEIKTIDVLRNLLMREVE